ncbi:conserved hypothetical protein [Methylobacterium nodulans ORS 2060]|uniref:Uncharacterized protein n=1 Tax=Methylobacterium nodulans (strain LMG 21967 / CNCM I-2342 / ORS 2060) TaxID=460265 RepID=B8ICX4_METNO|nr:conserved hypothetical protein [Methylobacterium nodulans ORS 2060]
MTSQNSPAMWHGSATALPGYGATRACPSGGDRLADALAPGLQAAFGGCLAEALPCELAESLAELLVRLDGEPASHARDHNPRR